MSGDISMQNAYASGKDLYSSMAAEAFHTTYENCREFYKDENGIEHTNPEGKKRRSAIKGVLLGLLYGRGTASVAEQLHMTTEEAQKLIDDFFNAYPAIKKFIETEQKRAKIRGYTETAWGRRRYLTHIQDEPYEYKYNNNRPINFNPLFTAKSVVDREVTQDIKDKYNVLLEKANFRRKQQIIKEAAEQGIDIIDNTGFIAESLRQTVNSIIQGSAADMSKLAMIKIGQNKELKELGFRMIFPVHDEIIAECPFENRKRCGELMSQLMIEAGAEKISVKMKCDVLLEIDDDISKQQYNDYINTGLYKDRKEYEKLNENG